MRKVLQAKISDEAWDILNNTLITVNANFKSGRVAMSDLVNEIILTAKVDVLSLQSKSISLKKFLMKTASEAEPDLEAAIKTLNEIRARQAKKKKVALEKQESMNDI